MIIDFLQQEKYLINALQNIGLALVTAIIPIGIALLGQKRDFKILDNYLFLDYIIKSKRFLVYIGLIFVPFLFWENSSVTIKYFEFILWCLGVWGIVKVIINSYIWIKGQKFKLRFEYLEVNGNVEEMEGVWRSVWETNKINPENEREFFKIFASKIAIHQKDNEGKLLELLPKLLSDFEIFIENRTIEFLVFWEDALPKLLNWHLEFWKKYYCYVAGDKKTLGVEFRTYSQLSHIIDSILRKVEKRALMENNFFAFINQLEQHIKLNKDVSIKHFSYIDDLMEILCNVFFNNIKEAPNAFSVWKNEFPDDWKITRENLEKSIIPRYILKNFNSFIHQNIDSSDKKACEKIDEIISELFPNVDTIKWSIIINFIYSSWGGNSRMKSLVENPRNFGFVSPIVDISWGDEIENEKQFKQRMDELGNNTMELAYYAYNGYFKEITHYIEELEYLEEQYKEDKHKDFCRKEMLEVFNQLRQFIDSKHKVKINETTI